MQEDKVSGLVDGIFSRGEDVVALVREGNYEKASTFGDYISYRAATENKDWWWDSFDNINSVETGTLHRLLTWRWQYITEQSFQKESNK